MDKNKILYELFIELQRFARNLSDDALIADVKMRSMESEHFPGNIEIAVSDGDTTHKIEATYSCESKGDADA